MFYVIIQIVIATGWIYWGCIFHLNIEILLNNRTEYETRVVKYAIEKEIDNYWLLIRIIIINIGLFLDTDLFA